MNAPKLRFKDNSGQFYPEWNEKSLIDICKINQGLQIAISNRFTEDGDGRYLYITNEFLRKDSKAKYFIENPPKSVLCSDSDILMTRTGNTGKVVTGVSGAFHNNFFKIAYDKQQLNKMFLYEFLTLDRTQSTILKLAGTSTIPDLNHGDFYKIKISFPTLPEQTKIANFLTATDDKINQLTQKIELLTQYKKGVMQQIFSQKLRFKDDDGHEFGEWEESTLGAETTWRSGGTPSKDNPEFWNGDISWFSAASMKGNRFEFSEIKLTHFGISNGSRLAKKDDLLLLVRGSMLFKKIPVGILTNDAAFNQDVKSIHVKESISSVFLLNWFLFQENNILNMVSSTGIGAGKLDTNELQAMILPIPTIPEQTKITNFFTALDDQIKLATEELAAVMQYKQGLLQQMFV